MKTAAPIINISVESVVGQAANQISSDLAGEVVILNLQSGVYYGLDAIGARIWNLIQEPLPLKDILAVLLDEYEVEPARCESDLLNMIEQLIAKGLIEIRNETNS